MGGSYSTQEAGIPQAAQGAWNNLMNTTNRMKNQIASGQYPGTSGYGGQKNLSMSPEQTQGLKQMSAWAMNPGTLETGATDMLNKTMSGAFLDPASNPFLQKSADAMSANMSKAIGANSQDLNDIFSKMGVTYRGPAEQKMRTEALTNFSNAMTGMYGNAYNNERNNMTSAANSAQSWANMPGQRAGALMDAGAVPTELASGNRNFNYTDFLNTVGSQQNAFMLPWQMDSSNLGSMPLAYPQQTYNKGPLDYLPQIAAMFMKGGA